MSITTSTDIQNGAYGQWKYDRKTKASTFVPLGRAVYIDDVTTNIETGDIQLTLSSYYLGEKKILTVPREEMADNTLLQSLAKIGLDATKKHFDVLVDSLRIQEQQREANGIPAIKVFNHLGWIRLPVRNDTGIIIGSRLHYRANCLIGRTAAKYVGPYSVSPIGSLEEWCEMVKTEVVGQQALELVLIAGMSAVINGLIAPLTTGENPIVHLSYLSGKGKTTAVYLATSAFGAPYDGERRTLKKSGEISIQRSVYGSWGATENATITQCAGNKGAVIVFNELSKFVGKDMSGLVYNLSEGSDKTRLNKQMKAYTSESYYTTILSTGENSLLARCKEKAEGLQSRVMELECPFTTDAEHSHRIKTACRAHNGWAASALAQYIIDNGGVNFVLPLYKKYCQDLTRHFPISRSSGRFIEKFAALFLTTAELASNALDIAFDTDGLLCFLVDYETTNGSERDTSAKSYDDILEECSIQSHRFYRQTLSLPNGSGQIKRMPSNECWGRICNTGYSLPDGRYVVQEIEIRPSVVYEILDKKSYMNPKTCIDEWKRNGVIDYEQGHNTRKRKIDPFAPKGDKGEHVFVFRIFGEPQAVPKAKSKLVTQQPVTSENKTPQLVELLNDEEDSSHDQVS